MSGSRGPPQSCPSPARWRAWRCGSPTARASRHLVADASYVNAVLIVLTFSTVGALIVLPPARPTASAGSSASRAARRRSPSWRRATPSTPTARGRRSPAATWRPASATSAGSGARRDRLPAPAVPRRPAADPPLVAGGAPRRTRHRAGHRRRRAASARAAPAGGAADREPVRDPRPPGSSSKGWWRSARCSRSGAMVAGAGVARLRRRRARGSGAAAAQVVHLRRRGARRGRARDQRPGRQRGCSAPCGRR